MPSLKPDNMPSLSRAISDAVTGAINKFGEPANLPPLKWEVSFTVDTDLEGTHPGGRAHPDSADLCEVWADFLAMTELTLGGADDGCRMWTGSIVDWQMGLFAITDMNLYRSVYPEDCL